MGTKHRFVSSAQIPKVSVSSSTLHGLSSIRTGGRAERQAASRGGFLQHCIAQSNLEGHAFCVVRATEAHHGHPVLNTAYSVKPWVQVYDHSSRSSSNDFVALAVEIALRMYNLRFSTPVKWLTESKANWMCTDPHGQHWKNKKPQQNAGYASGTLPCGSGLPRRLQHRKRHRPLRSPHQESRMLCFWGISSDDRTGLPCPLFYVLMCCPPKLWNFFQN